MCKIIYQFYDLQMFDDAFLVPISCSISICLFSFFLSIAIFILIMMMPYYSPPLQIDYQIENHFPNLHKKLLLYYYTKYNNTCKPPAPGLYWR